MEEPKSRQTSAKGKRRGGDASKQQKFKDRHQANVEYFRGIDQTLKDIEASAGSSDDGSLRLLVVQVLHEMKNKEWGLLADQRCSKVIERLLGLLVRIAAGDSTAAGSSSEEENLRQRLQAVKYFVDFVERVTPRAEQLAVNFYASHVLQTLIGLIPEVVGIERRVKLALNVGSDSAVSVEQPDDTGGEDDNSSIDQRHGKVENGKADEEGLNNSSTEEEEDDEDPAKGSWSMEETTVKLWEKFSGATEAWKLGAHTCGTHVIRAFVRTLAGHVPRRQHHLELGRRKDVKTSQKKMQNDSLGTVRIAVPHRFHFLLETFAGMSIDVLAEESEVLELATESKASAFIQDLFQSLKSLQSASADEKLALMVDALLGIEEARRALAPNVDVQSEGFEFPSSKESSSSKAVDLKFLRVLDALIDSPAGSRVLEVLLDTMRPEHYHIIFTRYVQPRLADLSQRPLGNFVVQRAIGSPNFTGAHLKAVVNDFEKCELLTGSGRAVLRRLFEACARLRADGGRLLKATLKVLGVASTRDMRLTWQALLTLRPVREIEGQFPLEKASLPNRPKPSDFDEEAFDQPDPGESSAKENWDGFAVEGYGCSIVESLMKLPASETKLLVQGFRGFTSSPTAFLVALAEDKTGSRVLEAVLSPSAPFDQKMKGRLCRVLLGSFARLAFNPCGSFVVAAAHRASPNDVKKRLASELVEKYAELKTGNPRLFKLCRLEEFKKSADEWALKEEQKSTARKHLAEILKPLEARNDEIEENVDSDDLEEAAEVLETPSPRRKRDVEEEWLTDILKLENKKPKKRKKKAPEEAAVPDGADMEDMLSAFGGKKEAAAFSDDLWDATIEAIEGVGKKKQSRKQKKKLRELAAASSRAV